MSAVRTLTLADVAWPRVGFLRDTLLVLAASVATALAAQVAVPFAWTPVPLTGQTFAVLLSGAVLGARLGFIAQVVYLLEGGLGLPLFAGGATGVVKLVGPTGGYLMAFPFAAALTGFLAERGWDRRFLTTFGALLLGSAVIFAFGLLWLARFLPAQQLLTSGLLPFIPGDLLKSGLASAAFPAAWSWVDRRRGKDA